MKELTKENTMNKFKKDEKAPKQEPKADDVKLGSNVPSIVEKVGNSQNNASVINPVKSEKK
ncbi:MAG: hypothetical protein Q8O20_05605 [Sulfuricurvum sp.]|nr:hypothetical protein [Sulfuricurvum sp.]